MAPYANALAISLLAGALIILGLKDQRCDKQPSRATTTQQARPPQDNPRRPGVTPNRRELSKF
jgi:hypothetical protein